MAYALLLAGGNGTRLWPLSQRDTPKQILSPLGEDKNLLEITLDRIQKLGIDQDKTYLVTASYQSHLFDKYFVNEYIVAEPKAMNTGAAILLAVKYLIKQGIDKNENIFVFPTDHYISDFSPELDIDLRDKILCYRIIPTRAETGYGYMKVEDDQLALTRVESFKEKPDLKTAQLWYQEWQVGGDDLYYWNSGIYAFTIESLSRELQKIDPNLYQLWDSMSYEEFEANYDQLPKMPFDKMIAERSENLYSQVLPATQWRDIGAWDSIYDVLSTSQSQNNVHIGQGQQITINSHGCLSSSDKAYTIASVGVEDLAIVVSGDVILVANKNDKESMQKLIQELQDNHHDLI